MSAPSTPSALLGAPGDRLLAAVAEGHPLRRACELAGIPYPTLRTWLLKGGDPASRARAANTTVAWEPYRTFACKLRQAQAQADRRAVPTRRFGGLPAAIPPGRQDALLAHLADGADYAAACRAAGVRPQTFFAWLRLGGYPRRLGLAAPLDPGVVREPYQTFAARVVAAEESFLAC